MQTKEELKEYKHKYYLSHKEELNRCNRKWVQEHKDAVLGYKRKYRQSHKEEAKEYNRNRRPKSDLEREYNRRYRETHKKEEQERNRKYRQENKEKERARRRKYYQYHKDGAIEYNRKRNRMSLYGLSPDGFEDMLKEQGGKCAICGRTMDGRKEPTVDHDHETGIVRGLLCRNCNLGIGYFSDKANIVESAARYLKKY